MIEYAAAAEVARMRISRNLCALLRPHNVYADKTTGIYTHTIRGKIYRHYRNRNDVRANQFFAGAEFRKYCDLLDTLPESIIRLKDHCVRADMDRLSGKKLLQKFFDNAAQGGEYGE